MEPKTFNAMSSRFVGFGKKKKIKSSYKFVKMKNLRPNRCNPQIFKD